MRVLFCGSRTWKDKETIRVHLEQLKEDHGLKLLVITGFAEGADRIAADLCVQMGIDSVHYPANWNGRQKSAGPVRNTIMLKHGRPERVYAFHDFLPNSKGTKHMVEIAQKAGVPSVVVASMKRETADAAA